MKKFIAACFLALAVPHCAFAEVLINEIACAVAGDDWVELVCVSDKPVSVQINRLYVTMYYGKSEQLSDGTVTIYSYDRPETQYDDRFVVVHLTDGVTPDETDASGDLNGNGCLDVYCNNYSGSLWNTDCVVGLDTDTDASNGMLDFVGYSHFAATQNSTIMKSVQHAINNSQWTGSKSGTAGETCFNIGADGLKPFMSIARVGMGDTNSKNDFLLTNFQTPGKDNIISSGSESENKLFSPAKKTITIIPSRTAPNETAIELLVYQTCSIRARIFTDTGIMIWESPLFENQTPGKLRIPWDVRGQKTDATRGLYLVKVEATSSAQKSHQAEYLFIVIGKAR